MQLGKFRWSKVYESSEEELAIFLQGRGLSATRWAAEAFDESTDRQIEQDTTLWCAEGSLNASADGTNFSMQPGDALRLPAGSMLKTSAGLFGCVCYETTR